MKRVWIPLIVALCLLPLGLYFAFLHPLDVETGRLRLELDQALKERESTLQCLYVQTKKIEAANQNLNGLRPYDLSKEPRPDSALANRSTMGLIDFSRLLEQAGITVDALTPQPVEYRKISLGGIAKCRYRLNARGPYRGMIAVFQAFKKLPANFEVGEYEVAYCSRNKSQAIVSLDLLLSFNYFLSPTQLDQASQSMDLASPSVGATTSVSTLERFLAWLDPPAYAQTAPKQFGRVEPFLPLDEATPPQPPRLALPAIPTMKVPSLEPSPLTLLSVMFSETDIPRAIVRLNGQSLHVQPGSRLPDGRVILAIGEKDILVGHRGTVRRFGFEEGSAR